MTDSATRQIVQSVAAGLAQAFRRQAELGVDAVSPTIAARLDHALSSIIERRPARPPELDAPPASNAVSPSISTPPRRARPESPKTDPARQGEPLAWVPRRREQELGVGSAALAAIREELGDCRRCGLCERRTNLVFGVGNPSARLMFVGEGPGAEEDAQGEPFVGKAGQLLDKMISAMGYARSDVYIANVVKCRPPGNRDPDPTEMRTCLPFLERQIDAVEPEVVVSLGRIAPSALLGREVSITRERGKWTQVRGRKLMPTFHPAFLLREPARKKETWADLQLVMQELARTKSQQT